MLRKYVYFFGEGRAEGRADMKNLLGGKGANVAEMINLGLPAPPRCTIDTGLTAGKKERKRPNGQSIFFYRIPNPVKEPSIFFGGTDRPPKTVQIISGSRGRQYRDLGRSRFRRTNLIKSSRLKGKAVIFARAILV